MTALVLPRKCAAMRIIFMGSPDFAVPSLDSLIEAGHDVIASYVQPPRPAGRGKADRKTAVQKRSEELGIRVHSPRSLKVQTEQEQFRSLDADLAVVAAYGLILPAPILEAPKRGCINVHASLLPRWRGAAPIQRAIIAGDDVSGITLMRMDEGLDTGPILRTRELDIRLKNAGQVTQDLAKLGARELIEWLDDPGAETAQPENGVTYAQKIDKAEARIDWSRSADEIERQVRAFNPVPGAWFEVNGERIKLLVAAIAEQNATAPGEVIDDELTVSSTKGAIRALVVQRAGRSAMTAQELLRGFPIPKGTILQ